MSPLHREVMRFRQKIRMMKLACPDRPAIRQRRSGQMPFQTLVASGGTSGLSESPSRFFNSLSSCWRC